MVWESPVIPWDDCSEQRMADLYYAWSYGNLRYKLDPLQQAVYDDIKEKLPKAKTAAERRYIIDWSRQNGKDRIMGTLALETAMTVLKARIPYGAPTRDMVEEILHPMFTDLLLDCPPELAPKRNGYKYVFPNGSKIVLVGCDLYPNRMRGPNSVAIFLTEPAFMMNLDGDGGVFAAILAQLLTKTDAYQVWGSTPPVSPGHCYTTRFVPQAKIQGFYSHATIYDNPRITKKTADGFITETAGLTSSTMKEEEKLELALKHTTVRRELFAEHVIDETAAIIPEWNKVKGDVCVDSYDRPDYCLGFLSIDPGQVHRHAHVYAYLDWAKDIIVFIKAYTLQSPNTEMIAKHIKEDEKELWKGHTYWLNDRVHQNPYRRVSDTNLQLINDLGSIYQLATEPINKTDLHTMVADFRTRVQNKKVRFLPGTEELQIQIETGVWDSKRNKFAYVSDELSHVDALAAAIYLNRIANQCRNINPWPPELEHMESPNYEPQIPLPRSNGWKKVRNLC